MEEFSLGGDSILDYAAIEQVDGAISVLSETFIVRNHANGCAAVV